MPRTNASTHYSMIRRLTYAFNWRGKTVLKGQR